MTLPGRLLNAANSIDPREHIITDFSDKTPDLGWFVVNDNVMGGKSEGSFKHNPDAFIFSGTTNTNGGGFSSVRTRTLQIDLSRYAGIRLSLKGDGRRYTWRLTTSASWRGRAVSYWADFATPQDRWGTVDIPFAHFFPRFRGQKLDGPQLDPADITGMGLMIYDKQDSPFQLSLRHILAYTYDEPMAIASN